MDIFIRLYRDPNKIISNPGIKLRKFEQILFFIAGIFSVLVLEGRSIAGFIMVQEKQKSNHISR